MKRIFTLAVVMTIATICVAQSTLVATLSHSGTISTFQGATALKEALGKCSSGDVITLSSGRFEAAPITKNITLRGMGMSENSVSGKEHGSTIVFNTLQLNIPSTETGKLRMEGIYVNDSLQYCSTIKNATFEKCRFNRIRYVSSGGSIWGKFIDCNFIHCRIAEHFRLSAGSNAFMNNCLIWNPSNVAESNSNFEFVNCIICYTYIWTVSDKKYYYADCVRSSVYRNCVVMGDFTYDNTYRISKTCTASYCISLNTRNTVDHSAFSNLTATQNTTNISAGGTTSISSVFKTGGSSYSDTSKYYLTSDAASKYIGSDGTQVGIYGGSLPYTEDPVRPRILNVSVPKRTTADGVLQISIQATDSSF